MSDAIPLAGVVGTPVAHSRSPALHAHWLHRYGLAGHYVPLDVAAADLATALRALPCMGFRGVNVTIPHKEAALAIADVISDRAARIGAANTLVFDTAGAIHAHNTDGYGFLANLRQQAPGWAAAQGPAAVFGAGGAARAVVVSLRDAGAPQIRVANRNRARARALCDAIGPPLVMHDWDDPEGLLDGATTVVNTTALGMSGQPPLHLPAGTLRRDAVVTDIVYTPLETPLLRDAAAHGCTVVDGLGMLLHQAVPGFAAWFGRRPEVDLALRDAVLGA